MSFCLVSAFALIFIAPQSNDTQQHFLPRFSDRLQRLAWRFIRLHIIIHLCWLVCASQSDNSINVTKNTAEEQREDRYHIQARINYAIPNLTEAAELDTPPPFLSSLPLQHHQTKLLPNLNSLKFFNYVFTLSFYLTSQKRRFT